MRVVGAISAAAAVIINIIPTYILFGEEKENKSQNDSKAHEYNIIIFILYANRSPQHQDGIFTPPVS